MSQAEARAAEALERAAKRAERIATARDRLRARNGARPQALQPDVIKWGSGPVKNILE